MYTHFTPMGGYMRREVDTWTGGEGKITGSIDLLSVEGFKRDPTVWIADPDRPSGDVPTYVDQVGAAGFLSVGAVSSRGVFQEGFSLKPGKYSFPHKMLPFSRSSSPIHP